MKHIPANLIDQLRQLMPIDTLNIMNRPLTVDEAKTVAERQARLLFELLHVNGPSAEVERLVELPEIEVKFAPNLPLSGFSEWTQGHWLIGINQSDSLWRCRATLCHEFKHVLDDPFVEILYPRTDRVTEHMPQRAEAISNYFAGCVLVPRDWLCQAWDEGTRDVDTLAALFQVSRSLVAVRLRQVGLVGRGLTGEQHNEPLLRRYTRTVQQRGSNLAHRLAERSSRYKRAKAAQQLARPALAPT